MPASRKPNDRTPRRGGLGADPLADIVAPRPQTPTPATDVATVRSATKNGARQSGGGKRAARVEKERATFHIETELLEEVRNAVVALSGPPERLTLAAFTEAAFRAELARLAKKYNGGQPFPQRAGEVRVGRPIGS